MLPENNDLTWNDRERVLVLISNSVFGARTTPFDADFKELWLLWKELGQA